MYIDKINKYKQKIKELKNNFKQINFSPLQSFRIKKIKKRSFLFNSSNILQNNSFSLKSKIISSNDFEILNNNKNFSSIKLYK